MSCIKFTAELARQGDISIRGVTVRDEAGTFNARLWCRVVNSKLVYSFGEVTPEAELHINAALATKSDQRLARMLP